MGFHPAPRRTDSPPRGQRIGGSEYRESRPNDRRDSRNRDRDKDRDRDIHQERDRSRSPYSRRNSDRYNRANDIPDRYDSSVAKYPSSWNIYRPEYPKDRNLEGQRNSTQTEEHSSSASPFHVPDRPQPSETSKKDSMSGNTREGQARRASKGGRASDSAIPGSTIPTPRKTNLNNDQDTNLQIPESDLTGSLVSPILHPVSIPGISPPTTAGTLASLSVEHVISKYGDASTEALGIVSKNLAKEAAKLSTLQFKLQRAEQNLQKRNSEFEKSKSYHEKYPDIKESHGSNIKEAAKVVNSLKTQVKTQEVALDNLALSTASQSLSAIISQANQGSTNQDTLEKVVQTCADFKELLESQRKLIAELQREKEESKKVHLELKDQLEAELKLLRDYVYTTIPQDQLKLQGSIDEIKRGAVELGTTVNKLSTKSMEQSSNISTLSNRTGDMGTIREELKKLTNNSPEISKKVVDLSKSHEILRKQLSDVDSLKTIPTTMAKNRQEFEETLESINTRLRSIELRPDISSVESRFQSLERLTAQSTADIATKKDLDALEERVKRFEKIPSPMPTLKPDDAQLAAEASVLDRVGELERRLGSAASTTEEVTLEEKLHNLHESVIMITSATSSLNTLPRPSEIERRLSALERGERDQVAPASNSNETATEVLRLPVEQRLTEMANEIEFLKAGQEVLEECIGSTVSQGIAMATADSGTKLEALQSQLDKLRSELENMGGAHSSLHERLAVALDPTNGIESRIGRKLQSFSYTFNRESQKNSQECERVNHELASIIHGLNNLTSRIENINTKEMAQYMLGQLADVCPNLQDTQTTIRDIRTAVFELDERVRSSLEAQQTQSIRNVDIRTFQEQIRSLTLKISEFDVAAKQAEETAAIATSSVAELRTELLDQLDTDRNAVADAIGESGSKMDDLTRMVTGNNEQIEALKQVSWQAMDPQASMKKTAATPTPSQVASKAVNTGRGSSTGSSAGRSLVRPASISSSNKQDLQGSSSSGDMRALNLSPNRQSSAVSAAIDNRRKPKRKQSVSSGSNDLSNSKSSSPERKRVRRAIRALIPESDEDLEYDPEDDIRQPQMGSDDNE